MTQRPIKFRAWDLKGAAMRHVAAIEYDAKGDITTVQLAVFGKGNDSVEYRMDGEDLVLMQSTGLRDCKGQEVFEGDIIMPVVKRYPFYDEGKPNYVGTIEWIFAGFHCVLNVVNKDKRGISDGVNEPFEEEGWCEVIGNIFSNPELISPNVCP